ncbi:MAG: PQQ-binding-like beta-propeller repeat protein [bacterium]
MNKVIINYFACILLSFSVLCSCDLLDPKDDNPEEVPQENVGKLKWTYEFDANLYSFGSAAIGPDGTIYLAAGGGTTHWTPARVYAINPDSTLKWKSDELDHNAISSEICIGTDGTIYVIGYYTLYAIDPSNGSFKWTWEVQDPQHAQIGCLAIGNDGTIFFSNIGAGSYIRKLFAVTPQGQTKWIVDGYCAIHLTVGINGNLFLYWYKWSPELFRDIRSIVAVNPTSGAVIWSTEIPDESYMYSSQGIAVTLSGDLIVSTANPNNLLLINSSDGSIIWKKSAITGYPSIAPNSDILMFGFNAGLYCYNSAGDLKWNIGNPLSGTHGVAIDSDGKIYVTGFDYNRLGTFQCFSADGNMVWALYVDTKGECSAIGNDGTIYASGEGNPGKLIAIQGDKPLASSGWPRTHHDNSNSRNPNR